MIPVDIRMAQRAVAWRSGRISSRRQTPSRIRFTELAWWPFRHEVPETTAVADGDVPPKFTDLRVRPRGFTRRDRDYYVMPVSPPVWLDGPTGPLVARAALPGAARFLFDALAHELERLLWARLS